MASLPIYAKARLSDALHILASHPGHIRQRLKSAAGDLLLIPRESLSAYEEVRNDIIWIQEHLTSKPERFPGQGRVSATLYRMRKDIAVEIAERIVAADAKLTDVVLGELAPENGRHP